MGTVIKEGKNGKGDLMKVVEHQAGVSYSVDLMFQGDWMEIEFADTKAAALRSYKSFGGK